MDNCIIFMEFINKKYVNIMELQLNIDTNHGNRIYSIEFLLSQCEQIWRGEIQVQLETTTCINVH